MNRILFILVFALPSAFACAYDQNQKPTKAPINIEADTLTLFRNEEVIIANGKVKVVQNGDELFADQMTIFKEHSLFHAKGNVIQWSPENKNMIFGQEAILNNKNNTGVIKQFFLKNGENTTMASKYGEMLDKQHLVANNMVYSSCKVCESNFVANTPTWQFRTAESLWDRDSERVYHKHAKFDVFGFPVFYTPYISTPAPGAKRKSGFLIPKFEFSSSNLGFNAKFPYYFNIAPNQDATYAPRFTEFLGIVHEFQYRQLLNEGRFQLDFFGTRAPKFNLQAQKIPGKYNYIGSYRLESDYTIKSGPSAGFVSLDSKLMKDDLKTFNIKYGYGSDQVLLTDLNYRKLERHRFMSIRPLYFQDLRPGFSQKTTPQLYPLAEYYQDTQRFGHTIFGSANLAIMQRKEGLSYSRVSGRIGLNRKIKLPYTSNFFYGLDTGADIYEANWRVVTMPTNYPSANSTTDGNHRRYSTNLYTKVSNSSMFHFGDNTIIFEPVVMPVLTGLSATSHHIPNEDSQDPEISAANLFEVNRFKGFDRVEKGFRINYGLMASYTSYYIRDISMVFGQIWRKKAANEFNSFSGMNKRFSDYVSSLDITLTDWLTLVNNHRFAEQNMKVMRAENGFVGKFNRFTLNGLYSSTNKALLTDPTTRYRKELSGGVGVELYKGWALKFDLATRLGKKIPAAGKKALNYSTKLVYKSECIDFTVGVVRNYTNNKDVKPSTTPMIQIDIPAF